MIMQSKYQRTQVPNELQFMILRTRLPFLCNMATTTCKPAQNLSFHWSGLCRKMSKVVTPSVTPTLTPERFPRQILDMPTMQPAARDDSGEQKRDYAWLSRDML